MLPALDLQTKITVVPCTSGLSELVGGGVQDDAPHRRSVPVRSSVWTAAYMALHISRTSQTESVSGDSGDVDLRVCVCAYVCAGRFGV